MKTKKILLNTVEKVKEFNRRVIGFPDDYELLAEIYFKSYEVTE